MQITRRSSIKTMAAGAAAIALFHSEWSAAATQSKPVIRIAFNENPDGPSPAARAAIRAGADVANRYVMDELTELERRIAQREGVSSDEIVLGTGSGEVLAMAGAAFGIGGGEIVCADNTFDLLPKYAAAVGAKLAQVPLTKTFHHDLEKMSATVNPQTSLVYVCNPNNPTGTLLDAATLRAFCEDASKITTVLVDEAYIDFEPDLSGSMIGMVQQGKNVIVTRTFSKIFGMAGMRIGYGVAPKPVAEKLKRLRMTWINHLSVTAALASLGETEFVRSSRARNAAARDAFCGALSGHNIRYVPSHTNFIYVYAGPNNRALPRKLLENGVMINRDGKPLDGDWVRVSVGTLAEMQSAASAFLKVYEA